ncbi:hypothetical protein F5141DRAFT_1123228 [Pisolithus sp. B1]|nr:hypothetical protein F5141DRAFT_1123228 [Pisolithus sp. B1]
MSSTGSTSDTSVASWIQSNLTTLFQSTGAPGNVEAEPSFDQIFSPNCEIRRNHEALDLSTLKGDVTSQAAGSQRADVKWEQSSIVAGAFTVTRVMPFRIRASLAQRVVYVQFSAKVEPQRSGVDDGRHITSFYYTVVDKTPPIHFARPHVAKVEKQD